MTADIYQEVTDYIVEHLETADLKEYQHPFACLSRAFPQNAVTEKFYNGLNILILALTQQKKAFASSQWATYKQWRDIGANVKKGEKGQFVLFYKTLEIGQEDSDETSSILMAKRHVVFNASQVENYQPENVVPLGTVSTIDAIETFVKNTGAKVEHVGDRAFFSPVRDFISMPDKNKFFETNESATENYYSTLLHELTHWAGHSTRLDRKDIYPDNKKLSYAFEELIAELGSAFLGRDFNLNVLARKDHVLYIKSWLQALKNDKKYIFRASSQAMASIEYLKNKQPA